MEIKKNIYIHIDNIFFISILSVLIFIGLCSIHGNARSNSNPEKFGFDQKLYEYLINCSLKEGTTIEKEFNGEKFSFQGSLGLAPEWETQGINEKQKRWVSSCMYARTNYFGVKVPISLRADYPSIKKITNDEEIKTINIEEGAFYGNLFDPNSPTAYVCSGKAALEESEYFQKRICAHPTTPGEMTKCQFIYMGKCKDVCKKQNPWDGAYSQCLAPDGSYYEEVMTVYLKIK